MGHKRSIGIVMRLLLLHSRVRVLCCSIVGAILGHVSMLTINGGLSLVRVAVEVVVNDLVTWIVVGEGALLAVIIFTIVVLDGRRFSLLFLIILTIAVIAACFMILVDRPKGSRRRCILSLLIEWLLQSVRVARVLLLARRLVLNHVILVLLHILLVLLLV